MRAYIFIPLLLIYLCAHTPLNSSDIKVLEGIAMRSKAGLVVCGVMITSLSEEEMNNYEGKKLRITGHVAVNHKWKIDESDPVKRQGFNMPAMYKVISIEIMKD